MLRAALLVLTFASIAVGCGGSSSKSDNSTPSAPWSNTAMQNLVTSRCATAGCHDGTETHRNYKNVSEATMKADTDAKTQVDSNAMPQDRALSTSEKAIFDGFYAN